MLHGWRRHAAAGGPPPAAGRRNPAHWRCAAPSRIARRERRWRSEEHTSELQSLRHLVCRLLLEKNLLNVKDVVFDLLSYIINGLIIMMPNWGQTGNPVFYIQTFCVIGYFFFFY